MDVESTLRELDGLFQSGQIDRVEGFLTERYERARAEGDFGAQLCLLNELIGYYREMTLQQQARQTAERILAVIEEAGLAGTLAEGTSLMNVANAYRFLGQYEASEQCYRRVEEIYGALLDRADLRWAGLYNNASLLYNALGDFGKAADSLRKALEIVRAREGTEIEQAVTYTNLGQAYLRLQDNAAAEEALLEAERLFGLTGKKDSHYGGCANALGTLYYGLGQYERAAAYYGEALQNIRETVGMTENYRLVEENLRACQEKT